MLGGVGRVIRKDGPYPIYTLQSKSEWQKSYGSVLSLYKLRVNHEGSAVNVYSSIEQADVAEMMTPRK